MAKATYHISAAVSQLRIALEVESLWPSMLQVFVSYSTCRSQQLKNSLEHSARWQLIKSEWMINGRKLMQFAAGHVITANTSCSVLSVAWLANYKSPFCKLLRNECQVLMLPVRVTFGVLHHSQTLCVIKQDVAPASEQLAACDRAACGAVANGWLSVNPP
jgi:hypothetical protein